MVKGSVEFIFYTEVNRLEGGRGRGQEDEDIIEKTNKMSSSHNLTTILSRTISPVPTKTGSSLLHPPTQTKLNGLKLHGQW